MPLRTSSRSSSDESQSPTSTRVSSKKKKPDAAKEESDSEAVTPEESDEGEDMAVNDESDGDGEDEQESDQEEDAGDDSESDVDVPTAKQRQKDRKNSNVDTAKSQAHPTSSSNTPPSTAAPSRPQLHPKSEGELAFHLKQIHRIMKKLRTFACKKVVRKIKEAKAMGAPADAISQLEKDLDISKHLDPDDMALYAWRIHNLAITGKRLRWDAHAHKHTLKHAAQETDTQPIKAADSNTSTDSAAASSSSSSSSLPSSSSSSSPSSTSSIPFTPLLPRVKELLSQILHSPACSKGVQDYISTYIKKQRKDSKREKKLDKIAQQAQKKKEKEKEKRKKMLEKLKGSTEQNVKSADGDTKKVEADGDRTTTDSSGSDAKDAATDSKMEVKRKKEASANADNGDVSSSGSDDDSDSDSDDEKDSQTSPTPAASSSTVKSLASKPSRVFGGLRVGAIFDGVISGVEAFGAFVDFRHKSREHRGLVHVSMLSDAFIRNVSAEYGVGDALEVIITKLDEKNMRISLGAKKSLFPADRPPKEIRKLSRTAQVPEEKKKNGKDATRVESQFVDSLQEKQKGETDARLDAIKKYVFEVSGAKGAKSKEKPKNRLGQRERRKLIAMVHGEEAEKKPETKSNKPAWKRKRSEEGEMDDQQPGASSENRKAKRARMREEAASTSSRQTASAKATQPSKKRTAPSFASDADAESLHPSWQAKQLQAAKAAAAPQGKKIKLDDD